MSVSRDFEAYVVEQLESAGRVRARRMFGGVGLYIDEVFCALIGADSSRLFLRVDDSNRSAYAAEGAEPFRPYRDRNTTMSYHSVPDHILDDRDRLREWALQARRAALAARSAPRRRRPSARA